MITTFPFPGGDGFGGDSILCSDDFSCVLGPGNLKVPRTLAKNIFFLWNYFFKCSLLAALGVSCSTWDPRCILWVFRCGTGTLVLAGGLSCSVSCGIFVPWPGIEPGSPALQSRFLTTGSPWKSHRYVLWAFLY